jgi:GT2 family glycosyltransferase
VFKTLPQDHVVIVIDSGSSDGTMETVSKAFPQVITIQGNPALWWAAATNLGVQLAKQLGCKYVLTYNDDNVATPNLFTNLCQAAKSAPNSIVAAVCCYAQNKDTVFFCGRMRARGSDRFYYLDHNSPLSLLGHGVRHVDMLHGMCTLFPMAVFDKLGLFDERAFPQVFADDDLLMKARQSGFSLLVALEAVVLNDRTKTGNNPYDRRLGPLGVLKLLTSRKSAFQLAARTRFLWRYRRSFWFFFKTWILDYCRLTTIVTTRALLPLKAFRWVGGRWARRLQQQ